MEWGHQGDRVGEKRTAEHYYGATLSLRSALCEGITLGCDSLAVLVSRNRIRGGQELGLPCQAEGSEPVEGMLI